MISTTTIRCCLLLALAGAGIAPGWAEDAPVAGVAAVEADETLAALPDMPEPDWSLLDSSDMFDDRLAAARKRKVARAGADADTAWSAQDRPNGAAAVSVKQSLSPFWDARIGADMTVVNQPSAMTTSDQLRQKFTTGDQPAQSSGSAWAAVTAPGVGSIWDKTAIEARVDPSQDQGKLGTSMSKSLPFGEQYSLTLQNGYNVTQQTLAPSLGPSGHAARNYQTEQSAKLSITDTDTSFIAGQSLSSTEEKWLRRVGAEQRLFGGVSVSATVSEMPQGAPNRSLTAGFKHSW
jgi:hypothetical protein